jgi:hypothetical protein
MALQSCHIYSACVIYPTIRTSFLSSFTIAVIVKPMVDYAGKPMEECRDRGVDNLAVS